MYCKHLGGTELNWAGLKNARSRLSPDEEGAVVIPGVWEC